MRFINLSLGLFALGQTIIAQKQSLTGSPSIPTNKPAPPGPVGLIITAYVTATIVNQLEVNAVCSTNGAITTIFQESSACETYTTCITIPASLCETFVSTQENGDLTTCTTPVETWTQMLQLPNAVLSTIQTLTASGGTTLVAASHRPGQPDTTGNDSQPQATSNTGADSQAQATSNTGTGSQAQATSKAGAQGGSPASKSPEAAQTTYVTAGANHLVVSSLGLLSFLVLFTLL